MKQSHFHLLSLFLFLYSSFIQAIEFNKDSNCSTRQHISLELLNAHPSYQLEVQELSLWMESKKLKKSGVALLIHGLNLRPSKMNSLGHFLTSLGIDTLRVSLSGHRGSKEEQKNVTRNEWLNQIRDHYCLALKRAKAQDLPLYVVAYSLGALMTLDFISNANYQTQFDKMIFFAPAIQLHWYAKIPSGLSFLGSWISLPSANLKSYRSNSSTSLAAYGAMGEARSKLLQRIDRKNKLNIPSLIFTHPNDELVSSKKIDQMIEKIGLYRWKQILIKEQKSELKKTFHHLIIDPPSLGKPQWKRVLEFIENFLES